MSEPAIEARGLAKRFGPIVALDGLDLEVAPGSVLAVLGPNGAGKTTLLRLLAGLARPSGGSLRVGRGGRDRRRNRAHVGFLGHATFLYPDLTARENLLFAARLYGVADPGRRADALLAHQGLASVAELPAGSFSRGMSQRLAIARALMHDPEVLLLDEPFTGLDRPGSDRLVERIAALRREGHTIVLVTHELAHAAALADAAIVLCRGRLAAAVRGAPLALEDIEQAYFRALDDAA